MKLALSALALVAANLVPIAGAAFYGWKAEHVIMLFWAETFVVGAWNVLCILVAQPPAWRGQGLYGRWLRKLGLALFFAPVFCFVNLTFGILLATFIYRDNGIGWMGVEQMAGSLRQSQALLAALGALVASHGVSFFANYLGGGEYRTVTPGRLHNRPYRRIVATWLLMFPAGLIFQTTGLQLATVVVIAVLKAGFDLVLHLDEHRQKARDERPRPSQSF